MGICSTKGIMLSHRPRLGPALLFSTALITLSIVYFTYHLWLLGETPTLRRHLGYDGIPRILWYKLGPKGLTEKAKGWTETCITPNPNYRIEFMDDVQANNYVADTFASRQDIVEAYLKLKIPILKADMLRYLLLFDQGGVWSDLDVTCEGPLIDDWVPEEYKKQANVVVGWEYDACCDFAILRSFQSWSFMARPHSPHMAQVITDIMDRLKVTMHDSKVRLDEITLEMVGDVMYYTGPRSFTQSIFKSLERQLETPLLIARNITELQQPILVGDVLIMPGYSMATGTNHYTDTEGGNKPPGPILVKHHYAGSWKNKHGGETTEETRKKAEEGKKAAPEEEIKAIENAQKEKEAAIEKAKEGDKVR